MKQIPAKSLRLNDFKKSILHVSTWDSGGGASNATRHLMQAQVDAGLNAKMYVGFKNSSNENVLSQPILPNNLSKIFSFYSQRKSFPFKSLLNKDLNNFEFSSNPKNSFFDIYQNKLFNKFDIIHLHWISSGLISSNFLKSMNKPMIWTLCDMWPITGGCHYSGTCFRFENECGYCPIVKRNKSKDISYKNLLMRKRAIESKKLFIVGKSKWMTQQAAKSSIFRNLRLETIGNIVNTSIFNPNKKKFAQNYSRIKIGIGGVNYLKLNRKNALDLELLFKLLYENNFEIVLFGLDNNSKYLTLYMKELVKKNVLKLIQIKDNPIDLSEIYHEFDVYFHTAIFENLSNQILEILSSGIPVIAFNVGGNSDLVINNWNGFLLDSKDLNHIICKFKKLCDPSIYYEFSKNARRHILDNFTAEIIINKYLNLYEDISKI